MRLRFGVWMGVPILLLGTIAAATWLALEVGKQRESKALQLSRPLLGCPTQLDLGPHEVKTTAVGTLTISNDGGQTLVIDQIRTSCACTGLERITPEGPRRVELLQILPGESVELQVRVFLGGQVGERFEQAITFRTSDPSKPEHRLLVVIPMLTGGVRTDPTTMAFGSVPVGTTTERVVGVYDPATQTRAVRSVTAFPADRISVELLPPMAPDPNPNPPPGAMVARLRVRIQSPVAGPVDGKLIVVLDGPDREPDVLPVSARVVGRIEILPSTLVLPQATGEKKLGYRGTCACSASDGKPLTLNVDACPEGVTAAINAAPGNQTNQQLVIELKPDSLAPGQTVTRNVRLRAIVGGETFTVEVPVLCRGVGP